MFPLNTASRIGLSVLLLLAGVVALRLGESFIVPILIALMLATVLGPAAWWLHETLKIRWSLACVTVVIGVVLANVLITAVFSASVMRLVNQLADEKEVLKLYNNFYGKLEKVLPGPPDATLFPRNPESIREIGSLRYLADNAPLMVRKAFEYVAIWSWQLIVILFTTFFVLLEGRMLARRAVAIFGPAPEMQAKATEVLVEMAKQVRNYLVWRTIINLGLLIVMGVIYQMCNLSQAWTWAILLAILNYIPYFGPVLASIPPFLDAFIFSDPAVAVVVFIAFWVVIVVEGYLVVPLLMGHNMDLNATTVMLACVFWELVWPGITGLFLAMPIMAGIKAILYHVPEWRVWADLLSATETGPPAPPPTATLAPPAGADLPNGKPGPTHADGQAPADSEPQRSDAV